VITEYFGWRFIRIELIVDLERIAYTIETIFKISYRYLCGDALLAAQYFDSIFLDMSIAFDRLEYSVAMTSLWVGSNSIQFLSSIHFLLKKVETIILLISNDLSKNSDFKDKKNLKAQVRFLMEKMGFSFVSSGRLKRANHLRNSVNSFINSMDAVLMNIEKMGDYLSNALIYKTGQEIAILTNLFEAFYHVKFENNFNANDYKYVAGQLNSIAVSRELIHDGRNPAVETNFQEVFRYLT
jgi:hypothetical protein